MAETLYPLPLEHIHNPQVLSHIYDNYDQDYYWSQDWSPLYYLAQAWAGSIAVALEHPQAGPLLLPQIQGSYALLDWENLTISNKTKRLMQGQGLPGVPTLVLAPDPLEVLQGIAQSHEDSWLIHPYRNLMTRLATMTPQEVEALYPRARGFRLCAWELRVPGQSKPVAGELGYTLGAVYTSLSGYFDRTDPRWKGLGWVQLTLLALRLQAQGYDFWNLGHPYMQYKIDLGAIIVPRSKFLERWHQSLGHLPLAPL